MEATLQFQLRHEECNDLMKDHFNCENITENTLFGVFSIQVPEIQCTTTHQHIIFTIDNSGSMSDPCKDNRTKMQHIKLTLENMIRFFIKENKERNASISFEVFKFSDDTVSVIQPIMIDSNEIYSVFSKINEIYPDSSTNIGDALETAKKSILEYHGFNPTHQITHVFMTDGNATTGCLNLKILKDIVNDSSVCSKSYFLGFGTDHDADMLKNLGDANHSEYQMIDTIEHAGLVYGEIIHSVLYSFAEEVSISIENGLLYDWKTNKWEKTIIVDSLVSSAKRDFHVIIEQPCSVTLKVHKNDETFLSFQQQIPVMSNDLMKFLWRQWTLQWLWKVIHRNDGIDLNQQMNDSESSMIYTQDDFESPFSFSNQAFGISFSHQAFGYDIFAGLGTPQNNNERPKENDKKVKKGLKDFFKSLVSYMEKHDLKEDPFMKNLSDDIYISINTMNTNYERMYNSNRQRSQGAQYNYTVNSSNVTTLNHESNIFTNNNNTILLDNESNPMRRFINSTYATPRKFSRNSSSSTASTVNNYFNDCNMNDSSCLTENEYEDNEQYFQSYSMSKNITSPYINRSAIRVMQNVSLIEDLGYDSESKSE